MILYCYYIGLLHCQNSMLYSCSLCPGRKYMLNPYGLGLGEIPMLNLH